MTYTVYTAYDRSVAFEGSADECRKFICKSANYHYPSGGAFIRNWIEDGDLYWDVGAVYIFNDPQAPEMLK